MTLHRLVVVLSQRCRRRTRRPGILLGHGRSAREWSRGDTNAATRVYWRAEGNRGSSCSEGRTTTQHTNPAQYRTRECTPSPPINKYIYPTRPRVRVGRPVRNTAHFSFEASRRSARIDVCRRVTENVGILLTHGTHGILLTHGTYHALELTTPPL